MVKGISLAVVANCSVGTVSPQLKEQYRKGLSICDPVGELARLIIFSANGGLLNDKN